MEFRKYIWFIFLFSVNQILYCQNFEGELTYLVDYEGSVGNGSTKFEMKNTLKLNNEYFDTLKIYYSQYKYLKIYNKSNPEKRIFDIQAKKVSIIENRELIIEDLNYKDHFNQKIYHYGEILSVNSRDTIIEQIGNSRIIEVLGENAFEKFIIADTFPRIHYPRNILLDESMQIYPDDYSNLINDSILIFYQRKMYGLSISYKLVDLKKHEIKDETYAIPKHKATKENKRFNKGSVRYQIFKIRI